MTKPDFFDRLEDGLRASTRHQAASDVRSKRRRRTMALAGLAAVVVAVPTSAAVVGVFTPEEESDGLVRTAPKVDVARGTDPEFGDWVAFTSKSTTGDCFGIRLIDPPGIEPGSTSEGCGVTDQPAQMGGGSGPRRTALFGFASPDAAKVRIVADNHAGREFSTHPIAEEARPFFFASLPAAPQELRNVRVIELDRQGNPFR